jgi:hypothetical protein
MSRLSIITLDYWFRLDANAKTIQTSFVGPGRFELP